MFVRHLTLAPYASLAARSRGRLVPEAASPTRSDFQRDRDRVIHSTAFRRLAHKTQVFVPHEGDHFRTRLTHTIEVAQIARALARALGLDEDLAEALALAHDLGHPPFGHAGEDVLDECLMTVGGFDHNAHALRIVTKLERRYAQFDGLNLTWETLEGLVKHNGPLLRPDGSPQPRYALKGVPQAFTEQEALWPLDLARYASAEAQVAAIADDIAYNAHDIDDGLRAGLFGVGDLSGIEFLRGILSDIHTRHPGLDDWRVIHELGRRVITLMVEDVIGESERRLDGMGDASELRASLQPVVAFSPGMMEAEQTIKSFLYAHMYRHPRVMKVRAQATALLQGLFACYADAPEKMSGDSANQALQRADNSKDGVHRVIGDYMAGMTDRYAIGEYARLVGDPPLMR